MNLTTRFFIYAPFAVFVGLALGLSVRWWYVAKDFSARLERANGHEVVPGVTLRFASKTVAGFPFRLDAVLKSIEIDVATPHGPARWRAPDFAMHALTYGRDQTIFEAAGREELDWTDDDGRHHTLAFVPGSMRASAILDGAGLSRFDIEIVNWGSPAFTVADAQLHLRRNAARDAIDLFVTASDVHPGPGLRSAFGSEVRNASLTATIAPGATFDRLRAGQGDWLNAVADWRGHGGSVHLDHVEIAWDRLSAMGDGALSLDGEHRPTGFVDLKFAGIENFLARAEREHIAAASNKGVGAALLARTRVAGADEMGRVGAVLAFKDGVSYVGDTPAGFVSPLY